MSNVGQRGVDQPYSNDITPPVFGYGFSVSLDPQNGPCPLLSDSYLMRVFLTMQGYPESVHNFQYLAVWLSLYHFE